MKNKIQKNSTTLQEILFELGWLSSIRTELTENLLLQNSKTHGQCPQTNHCFSILLTDKKVSSPNPSQTHLCTVK